MAVALTLETLGADLVAIAQCVAIDADAFPYPSGAFGARSARDLVWIVREPADGRVAGFLAGRVSRQGLWVTGIAVRRDRRRRGFARALLRASVERAACAGLPQVLLCVSVTNRPAIALYESEGFEVAERLRAYYSPLVYGGDGDALKLRRALATS